MPQTPVSRSSAREILRVSAWTVFTDLLVVVVVYLAGQRDPLVFLVVALVVSLVAALVFEFAPPFTELELSWPVRRKGAAPPQKAALLVVLRELRDEIEECLRVLRPPDKAPDDWVPGEALRVRVWKTNQAYLRSQTEMESVLWHLTRVYKYAEQFNALRGRGPVDAKSNPTPRALLQEFYRAATSLGEKIVDLDNDPRWGTSPAAQQSPQPTTNDPSLQPPSRESEGKD